MKNSTSRGSQRDERSHLIGSVARTTKICAAAMSALDTAGIFECDDEESEFFRSRIADGRIAVSQEVSDAVLDLANGRDSIANYETALPRDDRAMYLADSKALYRLHDRINKLMRQTA